MKKLLTYLWLFVCLAATSQADAQANITVQSNTTTLDFPNALTFSLQASSSAEIDQVSLFYRTSARSCTPGNVRVGIDFEPAQQVAVNREWDFKDSGSLPPGAQVTWYWEIRDAAGNALITPAQTLTIEDPTYPWNKLVEGEVEVYWVEGGQSFGRTLMQITQDALANLATSAGLVPEGKIRVNVYPSAEALQKAALFLPEWTGGVAIFEHGVIMAGIPEGETEWAEEVIPHEVAHLVTDERIFNCLGVGLPTWLSEGLAVSSEGPISENDRRTVESGLERGTLPLLRTLTAGFPADTQKATQAYAMSGAVVRFMLQEYGPDKMSALLSGIQSGLRIDQALLKVYGFATDGLDQAWRASLGYSVDLPLELVTPTPIAARTAVPTIALWSPVLGQDTQLDENQPEATIVGAASSTLPVNTPVPTAAITPASGSKGLPCAGSVGAVGLLAAASLTLRRRNGIR